jgi:hypothetical protein
MYRKLVSQSGVFRAALRSSSSSSSSSRNVFVKCRATTCLLTSSPSSSSSAPSSSSRSFSSSSGDGGKKIEGEVPDDFFSSEIESDKEFLDIVTAMSDGGVEKMTLLAQNNSYSWEDVDDAIVNPEPLADFIGDDVEVKDEDNYDEDYEMLHDEDDFYTGDYPAAKNVMIQKVRCTALLYAFNLQSLCNRYAIAMQSLYNRYTIDMHRYAIAMQLLCNRYAIDMQSLCNRYAIALQSLCNRYAIAMQ